METGGVGGAGRGGDGGEEGGAEEFDRTEGGASGDKVHLVFVWTREEGEAFRLERPGGQKKTSLLPVIITVFEYRL